VAIVVVGGSVKNVGKTALVCAVISALPEFGWTAVKVTGHDYEPSVPSAEREGSCDRTIWEETTSGAETDTARYLAAGARRALLVMRQGEGVPMEEIRRALGADRNIIFESNRIIDAIKPDLCIALVDGVMKDVKASFRLLLSVADVLVNADDGEIAGAPPAIPRFRLKSLDCISPQMANWLREHLHTPPQPENN